MRAAAWRSDATRWVGLGDLGLRAFTGLRHACRELLARERFDALFITIYPVYPALFGPGLKAEFGVPFILDYQDPWVGAWGHSVGGGPNGGPDWKSRAARTLGLWLEPRAVAAADALVAVSQGTLDGIIERLPAAARLPQGVIPLGFEPDDFDVDAWAIAVQPPASIRRTGSCTCATSARCCRRGSTRFACCCGGSNGRARKDPAAARLRLHFFGTSNQSAPDAYRVLPMARECGVADAVTEAPGRLDYLEALSVLAHASGILLLGTSERHYTASKLYPALLAERPILALFHEASSVVSILRARRRSRRCASSRTVTAPPAGARIAAVACHLERSPRTATTMRPTSRSTAPRISRPAAWHASWPPSSIGWPHDRAGPVDRGPDPSDSVLRAVVPPHSERAPEIALTVVHATSRRRSSRASASIARSNGTCR